MSKECWVQALDVAGTSLEILGVLLVAAALSRTLKRATGGRSFLNFFWQRTRDFIRRVLLRRGRDATVPVPPAIISVGAGIPTVFGATAAGATSLDSRLEQIEQNAVRIEHEMTTAFAESRADLDGLRSHLEQTRSDIDSLRADLGERLDEKDVIDVRDAIPGLVVTLFGLVLELVASIIG